MRCSSFNTVRPLLDEYVDGTLGPLDGARVEAHVASCDACAALLAELRVIDALLIAPRTVEPAANFTFAVMADVRALPVPHRHHRISLASLGAYLVFAWVAIGGFLFFGGHTARAALASIGASVAGTAAGANSLVRAVGHVFGAQTLGVTAAMGVVLAGDLLAAVAVFGVFATLRARRRAAAAVVVES
jgi:anti-sigma factor RsiW